MRTAVLAITMVCLLVSTGNTQQVKKGTLSGTIVTKGVSIPVLGSAPVYTAPGGGQGFFILTQFCSQSPGQVTLSGSVIGPVARTNLDSASCISYEPGVALAPAEVLTCSNASATMPLACTVTGVVSKK